jgi:hypothetical protein
MKSILIFEIFLIAFISMHAIANDRVDPGHPPESDSSDGVSDQPSLPQDPEQAAQILRQQAEQRARQIGNSWTSEGSSDSDSSSGSEE